MEDILHTLLKEANGSKYFPLRKACQDTIGMFEIKAMYCLFSICLISVLYFLMHKMTSDILSIMAVCRESVESFLQLIY